MHPLKTILDDSLGCAVWFASRARGTLLGRPYESGCRVVFLGQGADELFGGYMRHRTTLRHKGWKALHEEMDNEIRRISMRNLGRDDRVVADNGRQARFPFLDERVVDFATSLPPWDRWDEFLLYFVTFAIVSKRRSGDFVQVCSPNLCVV